MGSALDGARGEWNPSSEASAWLPKMRPDYPCLCDALLGEEGWEKGGGKRPPLSLILSNREGKLKFTLSNPEWPSTYHCTVEDASDVLASVEKGLADNLGEWVRKRAGTATTGRR